MWKNAESEWVFQRYHDLIESPRHRLGDIYRDTPAGIVYLYSFEACQLYVGVTTQKNRATQRTHPR